MTPDRFSAILTILTPQVIEHIVANSNVDEAEAIARFYRSKLYADLSNEELKVWYYSPLALYTLFQDELLTGKIDYPAGCF